MRLDDDNQAPLYARRLRRRDRRRRGARRRPLQHRAAGLEPLPPRRARPSVDAAYRCAEVDIERFRRQRAAAAVARSSAPRSSARRAGSAMRSASRSTGRRSRGSTTRCWSTRSPRSRRSTSAPSRRCSSRPTLDGRADLLVQLMQFHRAGGDRRRRDRADASISAQPTSSGLITRTRPTRAMAHTMLRTTGTPAQ